MKKAKIGIFYFLYEISQYIFRSNSLLRIRPNENFLEMKYLIFGCLLCVLGVAAWMHKPPSERLLIESNYTDKETQNGAQSKSVDWVNASPIQKEMLTPTNVIRKEKSLVQFAHKKIVFNDSIAQELEQHVVND